MSVHPRIDELEALLQEDGVPQEELKDAFILVNKEVLRHAELVDIMGAAEIGLVTAAAKKILNQKLETAPTGGKRKSTTKSEPKTAKGQIAKLLREAEAEETGLDMNSTVAAEKKIDDDWGDAF